MSNFINSAKEIIKENFKALSFASIIVLIPLMLLIITKLNPKNADIRHLNSICLEVYDINSKLASSLDENSVNTETAKEILPFISKDLELAKKNLLAIETSNSSEKLKDALNQCLSKNTLLVNQALSMYMSPDSKDLDKKIKDFKTTLTLYLESLETLDVYGMEKPISDNSLKFFNNTCTYFDTLLNLNMLNDISKSSERNFLLSLSEITTNFDLIKDNLSPAVKNIKETNRSLTSLLSDLDKKKNIFSKIEEQYYMLSIPESATVVSNQLESCIKSYRLYFDSITNAINNDLINADTENNSKLYDEALKKYQAFIDSYTILNTEINNLKNK